MLTKFSFLVYLLTDRNNRFYCKNIYYAISKYNYPFYVVIKLNKIRGYISNSISQVSAKGMKITKLI